MGLFSLFAKGSAASRSGAGVSSSHDSGSISRREFKNARHELVDTFGRTKGERISQILQSNMDRDLGSSFRGISAREADEVIKHLHDNPYDGVDRRDVEKLRGILDKHLDV